MRAFLGRKVSPQISYRYVIPIPLWLMPWVQEAYGQIYISVKFLMKDLNCIFSTEHNMLRSFQRTRISFISGSAQNYPEIKDKYSFCGFQMK